MASNREERRLQRLRGAQTHQVGDLDFGIHIPDAAALRPALLPLPSNRRTPSSRGRGRPSSASSIRPRITPSPPHAVNAKSINANISAKRRKLDITRESPIPSSSSRSTRSHGKRDIYYLEGDPATDEPRPELKQTPLAILEQTDELAEEEPVQKTPSSKFVPGKATPLNVIDEITESPRDAPGSGQRRRETLGQTQALSPVLQDAVAESTPVMAARKKRGKKLQSMLQIGPSQSQSSRNTRADDMDELSPDQPNRHLEAEQFSGVEGDEKEGADLIDDVEAATRLQRKRKRKSVFSGDVEESFEEIAEPAAEDNEDDELAERPTKRAKGRRVRPKTSPATQRQPKKPKTGTLAGKPKLRNGIPIAVQRLTKPIIYDEDDTDIDILNAEIPHAKRNGVNAVDVLAQVCEEVIESALGALEEGGSKAKDAKTRREYRTKLRAVEAFQEELRLRLFELTTMLDADYGLSKRVREAQKEKIQLRQELLRTRGERQQIALQMDGVRIKHESHSKEALEQHTLNANLQDIELAVSLALDQNADGSELAAPGLGIALKMVAAEVSSKNAEGGILKQIKEFNDFLERAAMILEGRA